MNPFRWRFGAKAKPASDEHRIWGTPELSSSEGSCSESEIGIDSKNEIQKILNDVGLQNNSDSEEDRPKTTSLCEGAENSSNDVKDNLNENQWATLHAAGQCKPCRFYASKSGCKTGSSCAYCHLPHKKRPSLAKREQCKAMVQRQLQDCAWKGPEEMEATIQSLSKKGMYTRSVVRGKVRDRQLLTDSIAHALAELTSDHKEMLTKTSEEENTCASFSTQASDTRGMCAQPYQDGQFDGSFHSYQGSFVGGSFSAGSFSAQTGSFSAQSSDPREMCTQSFNDGYGETQYWQNDSFQFGPERTNPEEWRGASSLCW